MAPSGYAPYSVSEFINCERVVIRECTNPTPEEFKDCGYYVTCTSNTLNEEVVVHEIIDTKLVKTTITDAPVAHGTFVVRSNNDFIYASNNGIGANEYTTGMRESDPSIEFLVREINNHPTSEQLFYPLDGQPFALLLGSCNIAQSELQASDLVLYHFTADNPHGKGVIINICTWHQPPYGDGKFYTAQAESHECLDIDFVLRDKKVLLLPNGNKFGVH